MGGRFKIGVRDAREACSQASKASDSSEARLCAQELQDIRNEMESLQHDSGLSKQASEQKRQVLIGELQRATARAKLEGTTQHLLDVLNTGQAKLLLW